MHRLGNTVKVKQNMASQDLTFWYSVDEQVRNSLKQKKMVEGFKENLDISNTNFL